MATGMGIGPAPVCDSLTHRCVAGCMADTDCMRSRLATHCSTTRMVCVQCNADADCPNNPLQAYT